MPFFDGFIELIVSEFTNQNVAGRKQQLLFHSVSNLSRVFHRSALVAGQNQASKLFCPSRQGFVERLHKLRFQSQGHSPRVVDGRDITRTISTTLTRRCSPDCARA
ncbi:MAG TPA: hypothetical protein VEJ46_12145 [Candidatus Acidoferrum sp.]|nr:hypothetical protein [Candidatus Acidoferrum sp.]